MLRRAQLVLAAIVLATVASCKCGKPTSTSAAAAGGLTAHLPKTAETVVVVPNLSTVGEKVKLLQDFKTVNFIAQLQGFGSGAEMVTSFMSAAGVDLRSPEELGKIGVDPTAGVGIVINKDSAYSVVALKDEEKFRAFLKNLALHRLGAAAENVTDEGGLKAVAWSRSGTVPALGYVVKDGFAYVAPNTPPAKLREYAAVAAEQSIFQDPALAASLKRLPEKRDLYVYAPNGNAVANALPVEKVSLPGGTVALNLAADGVTLNADIPWSGDAQALKALEPHEDTQLFDKLPKDAFLVARFAGDPNALAPFWPKLVGPNIKAAFDEQHVDVSAQVLSNLKAGIVLALSVANTVRFDQRPDLDVRRTNPFNYVHLVALGQPKDVNAANGLLGQLPAIAPKFGAKIEPATREGQAAFVTHYSQGEGVHFAVVKDTVVAGSPLPRFDEAVATVAKGEKGPGPFADPAFAELFKNKAVAVLIDLQRLADSVRNLPGDAWGPGGSFVKAGWMRWLDGMDDLRAITVSVSSKESAVQADVTLRLQKK